MMNDPRADALFTAAEVEACAPVAPPGWASPRERLYGYWARHLLENPARYPALSPDALPDPARREGEARRIAVRRADEALLVARAAGLELCDSVRMGDLKEIIADFLTFTDADGMTCDSDWDDLLGRARAAITPR